MAKPRKVHMVTWGGVGFHRGVIPRSWKFHLKVTARSSQYKMVESTSLDQHFQYIGQIPTRVHMMTSPPVNFRYIVRLRENTQGGGVGGRDSTLSPWSSVSWQRVSKAAVEKCHFLYICIWHRAI